MKENKNTVEKKATTQSFITQPANTDHLNATQSVEPIKFEKPVSMSNPEYETESARPGQYLEEESIKPTTTIRHRSVENPKPGTDVLKKAKRELDYIKDEYAELVTGTIINHEQPGNPIEYWFRGNGCPDITKFEHPDNGYIRIPVGVAEHLNKNCWIGKDKDALSPEGKPIIEVGRKVRRYTFYPSGYFGPIDLKPVGEPMLPLYKQ